MKKPKKKAPKVYTQREVAQLMAMARKTGIAAGKASCGNDHVTVTAPLGELHPNTVYCLVRAVPLEIEQPKATLGFGA
jgi:protoporphyrinogen oxidase